MLSHHSLEFKLMVVGRYSSGVSQAQLCREYKLDKSTIQAWRKRYPVSSADGVLSEAGYYEKRLVEMQEEITKLKVENECLRQAALIVWGQKK